jgi:antitoxin ParD1/3/4
MGTMNISLPDPLREFVDGQVSRGGYGTSSEYVRDLIRRDQERLKLRELMLAGAAAPVSGEANDEYFKLLRRRAAGSKPQRRRA